MTIMESPAVHLYCVDGSNLVRSGYGYEGPAFRAQEEADAERLIAALDRACAAAGGRLEIEVFFDGPRRGAPLGISAGLSVRFTHELEADDLILDRVRARSYAGVRKVTVVTADSALGRQVEGEGGRWQRVRRGAPLESVVRAIEGRFKR
ncbi:MAG: NYN domain-containing protein [Elusimicrobia bacterium]|nr:NYN domain-containing protein [Elusimicrobiota bacterium]